MTAAKVMDIISRLPGCSGQTGDAVSENAQVKMEDSSTMSKNSKVRMSRCLGTSTEAQMAQNTVQNGRPSRSYRNKSVRSSSDKIVMGEVVWESSFGTVLGKSFKLGMFLCQQSLEDFFLSMHVDDIKLAGTTENIMEPTWKIPMEDVDLGEPTSRNDHIYLGCTQRECQICEDIVANYSDMFLL